MKEESRLFIGLVNKAMAKDECKTQHSLMDGVIEKLNSDENILKRLYALFEKHKMVGLLVESLNKVKCPIPRQFSNVLMKKFALSIMQDTAQKTEAKALMDIFEKEKLPVIMLKGWIMKKLYPRPELRNMADLDIFMNISDEYRVHEIMLSRGYECINFDHKKDNVYQKPKFLTIEMHKNLFKYEDDWNTFFERIWDRTEKIPGFDYVYQLDKELYYVYMVAHMAKHLKDDGGIGVRAFLDLWVYRDHYRNELNYAIINNDLMQLGLEKFEDCAVELSEIWFGQKECIDPIYEEMGEYIIACGAYGNKEFFVMNNAAMEEQTSRFKYLFKRAFPNRQEMELRFPEIKEKPILIIYFWWYRLFKYGLGRKTEVMAEVDSTRNIDYEKMAKIKTMYEKIGL